MYFAESLTPGLLHTYSALYTDFCQRAESDYGWDQPPLPFEALGELLNLGEVYGYGLQTLGGDEPAGLMLYRKEAHRSLEINLIIESPEAQKNHKVFLDVLMRKFLADARKIPNWDVMSYAMLGVQHELINTITWYGFKPVGQAIVNFSMMEPLPIQVLKTRVFPPLPEGMRILTWLEAKKSGLLTPEFMRELKQSIFEAFSGATDALWDPRFRTMAGIDQVMQLVTSGAMGDFVPEATTLLLDAQDTPVGFCFMVQTGMLKMNIPLIGLRTALKGQKLSRQVLHKAVDACVDGMLGGSLAVMNINATLDTDNGAAIKMYRAIGFQEQSHYPHVYLPRKTIQPDYHEVDETVSAAKHPSLWVSQQLNPAYDHPATQF
ncbi:MAG: hypothetical protein VKJ06_06965 [Vampirovibrionales bacterium]|nr:hypothetical protein [Vampirovibrionales bacterium]